MKKVVGIAAIILSAVLCNACGKVEAAAIEPAVTFQKNGTMESILVESFEEDYYSLQELQDMIEQEVLAYNGQSGREAVRADEAYMSEQNVVVKLTYASYEDYNVFNERNIFVGTVQDALDAGVEFKVALESIKEDGTFISDEQIRSMEDCYLLIVDEPGIYNTFGKVLYASDGVVLSGKKSVSVSEDMEGLGYILFR